MKRILTILWTLSFLVPVGAKELEKKSDPIGEVRLHLPSCEPLLEYRLLCVRMREAQARVATLPLKFFEVKHGSSRSVHREFAVMAYDPGRDQLHEIILAMPLVVSPHFQPTVVTNHDPPYLVQRIKGSSYNKMMFRVWVGTEELFVLSAQYLSVELSGGDRSLKTLTAKARPLVYLSAPSYLLNDEFVETGRRFFRSQLVERTFARLRELGIRSKAYPGKLVADTKSPDDVMSIILAEQGDRCLLSKRKPSCAQWVPTPIYNAYEEVLQAVYLEFMVNGDRAFSFISSSKDARGISQFTNSGREGKLGTYDLVRQHYPEAGLDPNFFRGTEDFVNSTMAQVLLLDLELAHKRLPEWVRTMFIEERGIGRLIPGAAYNCGSPCGVRLSLFIDEFRRLRRIEKLAFASFPWEEFFHWMRSQPMRLNNETDGYVGKMVDIEWHFLGQRR